VRAIPLFPPRAVVAAAAPKAKKPAAKTKPAEQNGGARQLLGMKGASETDDKWAIRLQLTKPVTWVPLIWGVLCGAAASGEFTWTAENVAKSLLCMTMSGPLLTGYTQARAQRRDAWEWSARASCARSRALHADTRPHHRGRADAPVRRATTPRAHGAGDQRLL
jgi:hypothetical protein